MLNICNLILGYRSKAVKKIIDILSVRFLILCNNNLGNFSILINTNIQKNVSRITLLIKRYNVTNKAFTISYLVDFFYRRGSVFGKLNGFICAIKDFSQVCVNIFLSTVVFILASNEFYNLKCIRNSLFNESGCDCSTGYMLNVCNLVFGYRSKSAKKRIDILSVRFLLASNNNLGNFTIIVNTNSQENISCITLLIKSYNVSNKFIIFGNLVDCLNAGRCIFRALYWFKISVKHLSKRVINLLFFILLNLGSCEHVNNA